MLPRIYIDTFSSISKIDREDYNIPYSFISFIICSCSFSELPTQWRAMASYPRLFTEEKRLYSPIYRALQQTSLALRIAF